MQVRGGFWSGFCARARYVPDGDSKGTTALARVASAAMIDEILDELRECIELVAGAWRSCVMSRKSPAMWP